jgi:hypothetical protein
MITGLNVSPNPINENDTTTLSGSFVDTAGGAHSVSINWGDQATSSTLTLPPGTNTFNLLHKYLDNQPGNAPYQVQVQVTGSSGRDTAAAPVQVNNVAPGNLSVNASPATLMVGNTATLSGHFTDPGTRDAHQVQIDWGDSSPSSTIALAPGVLSFAGVTHQYQTSQPSQAPFPIHVTVTDNDGASATAGTNVTVSPNPFPGTGNGQNQVTVFPLAPTPTHVHLGKRTMFRFGYLVPEGNPAAAAQAKAKVTIAWGDGTHTNVKAITDAGGGLHIVQAPHTYTRVGDHKIKVRVVIKVDGMVVVKVEVEIEVHVQPLPAPPPPPPPDDNITSNANGQSSHEFSAGVPRTFAINFADPAGDDGDANPDFKVEVNWGDGTPAQPMQWEDKEPGKYFAISDEHTYQKPGQYTIIYTVQEIGGEMLKRRLIETVAK